ncbi:MAG TPA: hypothetical protein VFB28_08550 [Terriglobales bacterium]|nr:hypothetical protein [Terriglobales bacterium]
MEDKRRRNRVKAVLPVRVASNASSAQHSSELVHTLDITEVGARLGAVHQQLEIGSLVTLQYKQHRATFRVIWTEQLSGSREHQVGLLALNAKDLWGFGAELRGYLQPHPAPLAQTHAAS